MKTNEKELAADDAGSSPTKVDPVEFDGFYRKYFLPLVRRATWKHGLTKEDARDVVQEAFIVALVKLDPRRNPKAWLIQVVDHLSANFQRKIARRAKLVSTWCATESVGSASVSEDLDGLEEMSKQGGDYYQ